MKKILFVSMLFLANTVIAQPSIFHGVGLSVAEVNENNSAEFVWSEPQPTDFPVIMHKDTLMLVSPYQLKRFTNGKYRRIDHETEEWESVDEAGEKCWVYLLDFDEGTFLRIEYAERAYFIEITL